MQDRPRPADGDSVRALGRAGEGRLLLLVDAVAALLFALATLTPALPEAARRPTADLVLAVAALVTGLVVLRASRRGDAATARAWRCGGLAVLAWGGGQLCFGLEHLLTGAVQRPGLSDVGFVAGVALAVRAALVFPTIGHSRTGRGRAVLDAAVVAGCALLVTWLLVLDAPRGGASPDGWGLLLAYPLLDCAIATVLVSAAARLPREHATAVSLALAGVLVLLVTNLVTFTLARTGQLGSPEPAEGGFLIGFALIGTGSLLQSRGRTPAAEVTSLLQQLLPFVGLPPVVAVLLLHPERLTPGSVTLAVVLGCLLLVRQVVVVHENDQLHGRLLQRAQRYEALVQGSADLTLVIAPDGVVTDASPSVLRLLGDVRGRQWAEVVAPDDAPVLAQALERCSGLPDGVTTGFRLAVPGGDPVHVDARLTDLTTRAEVGGVVVNARDVTDRWQALRALEDSERRYRQMAETAAEGLAVSDRDGVLSFANRRLAEVLGQPLVSLVGRREQDVMAPLLDAAGRAVMAHQNRLRDAGRSSTYDLTLTRRGGATRHVRIAATPLHDAAGEPDGSMALVTDITAQVELEQRLQQEAVTDDLTGLGNRRALVEAVPGRLAGRALALLYIDLDDFKQVNDSLGHPAGDRLLREVAGRLAGCVREGDLVVRLGGDEFAAVLVDEDDDERAVEVAERVLRALARPVSLDGREVRSGASIGVALSGADEHDAVTGLLRDADAALYAAKAGGRGQVCRADRSARRAAVTAADLVAQRARGTADEVPTARPA